MAIDVAKLQPVADFTRSVDGFVRAINAVRPAQGFDRVIVPGQPEAEKEARYAREGIPLRDEDWERVRSTAGRLGVEL